MIFIQTNVFITFMYRFLSITVKYYYYHKVLHQTLLLFKNKTRLLFFKYLLIYLFIIIF